MHIGRGSSKSFQETGLTNAPAKSQMLSVLQDHDLSPWVSLPVALDQWNSQKGLAGSAKAAAFWFPELPCA